MTNTCYDSSFQSNTNNNKCLGAIPGIGYLGSDVLFISIHEWVCIFARYQESCFLSLKDKGAKATFELHLDT